ncbi:glycosyltransferase involved in cell wall biosynthesis [Pontibacter ramchanderi]|uniref:Glycosyltransferase involved in cell wall biosynthesis n=2 Tax=Pontibacter ramchanderi TaxID=1179743 RepID=A0A2N3V1S3_9BACT|nr:glycosyltransferase involved in cell wall biosynthesis [Pontibacter ramchanderi]
MGQEFAALGHEVVHISRSISNLPVREKLNGVEYIRVKGYNTPSSLIKLKWLDLLYSLRAIKMIPEDSDIIVTNTFWSPMLIHKNLSRKVYVSVERFPRGQMKFYKAVGRLRGCSPVICEAIKSEVPSIHQNLISYIPNPVPFDIVPVHIKRTKTILFVGRLHPEKGVHILLKSFKLLEKEVGKDWKLIIIGPSNVQDGGGGDAYCKALNDLSSDLNVEFTGPIYNEKDLISFYASSTIFCYPVQQGSGDAAPVAPREAMAYGCVPVVSELACFNDFIQNNINGLTFNQNAADQEFVLAQTLIKLIRDEKGLKAMSEAAKLIVKRYSPQTVAKLFVQDFKSLKT